MKAKLLYAALFILCILCIQPVTAAYSSNPPTKIPAAVTPMGTGFTYQGTLQDNHQPADGVYDLQFSLYAVQTGGTALNTRTTENIAITHGLFTVYLDFGAAPFNGEARWLEAAVRPGSSTGDFTTLTPRQYLSPVPYALYASTVPWSGISGAPTVISSVSGGPGLTTSGTAHAVTLTANFSGTGVTSWIARADHNHDSHYSPLEHTHPGTEITSPVNEALSATTALTANYAFNSAYAVNADQALTATAAVTAEQALNAALLNGQPADSYLYTAGTGLDLNSNQFSVNTNTIQLRAGGTCPGGRAIRAVNNDGSVVCQTDIPLSRNLLPQPNSFRIFDANVNGDPSENQGNITIGVDGLPIFTFYSTQDQYFNIVHCNNISCTEYVLTRPDNTYYAGEKSSLAIGADGLPIVSYNIGNTNPNLKVLHCENITCTAYTTTVLNNDWVIWNSITIGGDGLAIITYINYQTNQLKTVHCNNLACTSSSTVTIDQSHYWSIGSATGVDGLNLAVYTRLIGANTYILTSLHCNSFDCSSYITSTLENAYVTGKEPTLVIGQDGLGLITYSDDMLGHDLHVGHCVDITCTAITKTTPDRDYTVGNYSSVTIGPDGFPVIAYQDTYHYYLKYAHCGDPTCTTAAIQILDNSSRFTDPGYRSSITIGPDGLPIIIYYAERDGGFRMIRCANIYCAPYFRRK